MDWIDRLVVAAGWQRPSLPVAYVGGALLIALAIALRLALDPVLVGVQFIFVFPAIIVVALLGGLRPGAFAALIGGIAAWYFLIEPRSSFAVKDLANTLALAFYVLVAGFICLAIHALQVTVARLRRERQRQEELSRTLERRVEERTAEIAAANAALSASNTELALAAQRLQEEIEERQRVEAVLRQAQKMEAVGELTGGIAHDFNNLLTVIIGNLDTLRRQTGDQDEGARVRLDAALAAAGRAASLTERLLAFARRQTLEPKVIDANRLVTGMDDLLRRALGPQVVLETVLAAGPWHVHADPNQLENALLNLAINARDAMPAGGRLTIETANAELDTAYAAAHVDVVPGQYVAIAVTDTGSGMPAWVKERAFEPFFTTKEAGRGTGLGLSQVYGFVKQSGGHVKIYSEPGSGTTVRLYLPKSTAMAVDDETRHARERPGQVSPGLSVLVVEDDPFVRLFAVGALEELGYRALEAPNGQIALDILGREPAIGLLLTDVGLPGMDGRKLAEAARRLRPELRVLFMTGFARNAIVHNGVLDPGVSFVAKPFTVDLLARKLAEVLAASPDERPAPA